MKKGTFIIVTLAIIIAMGSCKRRHLCYCVTAGERDTVVVREYRGYKKEEAQRVCSADNYASSSALEIECNIR